MHDPVRDIVNRIRAERPTDPKAVAERYCHGDPELLTKVLDALGSDQGTMEMENAPTTKVGNDSPPPPNADDATVETPRSGSREVGPQPDPPSGSGSRSGTRTTRLRRPDRIGHFQIESEVPIGRGGFGEVWEAFRVEGGFRQRVAVKIISRATPDDKAIRRFELERQVLASLDHPAIARLIDGGEMEDGRPWLAMEYVDGVAVTKFCDRERLSIDERLRLFMKIAMAVQHAHENLVVHRDIKPDNVLVTAKGEPKLLDFGIAKLVNPDLGGDGGRVTQAGEGVLTPDYAAPEQFTGEGIGTRTDVYSLGVLLYELLTSRLPFHDEERGYVNIRTAKLEKEPPRPSDAVSTASFDPDTARKISTARDSGLDRIKRRLDGDLDVIILKALRREPSRRYASPRDLVEDLQRHIDGLPVEARPDSIGYRTTRFVARHRAGFAIGAVGVIAIAFAASTFAAFSEARSSQAMAETAQAKADAESARAEASEAVRSALAGIELLSAAKGTEILINSLADANQLDDAEQLAIVMLDRLDTAIEAVGDDPDLIARKLTLELMRANLRHQRRNPSLGDREDAAQRRSMVRQELEMVLDREPDHPDLLFLNVLLDLADADAINVSGRRPDPRNLDAKRTLIRSALANIDRAEAASNRSYPRQRAMLGTDLGNILSKEGKLDLALDSFQTSLASHATRGIEAQRDMAILETRIASTHELMGNQAEAIQFYRSSLDRRKSLAGAAALTESGRARRDLAIGHFYLSEALSSSSPASARRHLEEYLDLTFEVAWLDPLDHRGAVSDLLNAMKRASNLIDLNNGDIMPFYDAISHFRLAIIEPRLKTLPGVETQRLAIRADRYLASVEISFYNRAKDAHDLAIKEAREEDATNHEIVKAGHREQAIRHLEGAIQIGRDLLATNRSNSEIVAEIGLCITWRIDLDPDDSELRPDWLEEARDLYALSSEISAGGTIQNKLAEKLQKLSSDPSDSD